VLGGHLEDRLFRIVFRTEIDIDLTKVGRLRHAELRPCIDVEETIGGRGGVAGQRGEGRAGDVREKRSAQVLTAEFERAVRVAAEKRRQRAFGARLFLIARAVVVFAHVARDNVDRRVVGRQPARRAAQRVDVAVVDVAAVEQVLGEAVALDGRAGEADRERVGQRQVQRALRLHGIEVAVFSVGVTLNAVGRGLLGDDVDDAAGRVAAEQGALRTAQDFKPLDVEELGLEQARRVDVEFVEVDRGRGFRRGADRQRADAADRDRRARELRARKREVRNVELDVLEALQLARREVVAAKR